MTQRKQANGKRKFNKGQIATKNIHKHSIEPNEIVLFTDNAGCLFDFDEDKLQSIIRKSKRNRFFWKALDLNTESLSETLKVYPPYQYHEIPCCDGPGYLLRLVPLPDVFSPSGGYVLVITANLHFEAICRTYKERLDDNIAAWSDSIALFNAIFDTAKDSTLLLNESGIVLTANIAALGRHAPEGQVLAGTPAKALFGKRFRSSLHRALTSIRPKDIHTEQVVALDRDGQAFPAEAILRKITFSAHSLYQLILHDLTTQEELRGKKAEVEEMNIALRQVIRSVEEERQELREQLSNQVKAHMLPALEQVAKADSAEIRDGYISLIEEQLTGLTEEGAVDCDSELLRLSPREFRVCQLIQMGQSGKEISRALSISFETLQTHRKNIRRKLGLRGKSVSLYQYLRQKMPMV